jgi:hypothetical protein
VPLNLTYEIKPSGDSGFVLELANPPLNVPGGLATITGGRLAITLRPSKPSVVVALKGGASLTSGGTQQANQLLSKVFPSAPPIQPLSFAVEREFGLVDGAISASGPEIGTPRLRFDLDWGAVSPPDLTGLSNFADKLKIDIGKPTLTLPLGSGTNGAWTLKLRDCALRFPGFEGLQALSLKGLLTLESTATEDKLLFSPTSGGEIEFPDIVRFFLSRLGWSFEPGVDLETVVEAAEMSQGDWDWSRFFGDFLPDPLPTTTADLSAFAAEIEAALDTALQELTRARLPPHVRRARGTQSGDRRRGLGRLVHAPPHAQPRPDRGTSEPAARARRSTRRAVRGGRSVAHVTADLAARLLRSVPRFLGIGVRHRLRAAPRRVAQDDQRRARHVEHAAHR